MTFGLWLGLWVYLSNKRSKAHQIFLLVTIFLLIWVFFGFLITLPNQPIIWIILWTKIAYIGVFGWLVSSYFFLNYFPLLGKRSPFLDWVVLGIGIGFSLVTLFTNLLIKGVEIKDTIPAPILGEGLIPIYVAIILLTFLILKVLFQKYFKFSQKEKLKAQYFLIGLLFFISMNIIFNVFLSPRLGMIPYAYIGNYSAIIFLGFTAFAIIKRELFGIRVVLTTLFVGLIGILLFLDTLFFTPTFSLQILKGVILIIFIFFGYSLIRSILREIKLREQLQEAYRELKKLDRAKSEFISIASHQLRTPLTAIKGYISMILEGSYGRLVKKTKNPMKNVYKSSERLIRLVNDLLSVSKIESGKMEVKLEKVPLEEIITSVVEELKNTAKEKNIYLKWEKPKKTVRKISVDGDKIRQVILNIVDNAIHYTKKGGVTIKYESQAEKCKIIVSDTGEGIIKEDIHHLFESFTRGKAGIRFWTEGTGLGLYVSKKFVEMHNGKIWAESEGKGKGSTFYIELPRREFEELLSQF